METLHSNDYRNLIDRFDTAFNDLHAFFRNENHQQAVSSGSFNFSAFTSDLSLYSRNQPPVTQTLCDKLFQYAQLRNSLTHTKNKNGYIAIPTTRTVGEIEEILNTLRNPAKVFPDYQTQVQTVKPQDKMKFVFELIASKNYSQFPVYEEGQFVGLLTENGITMGLAKYSQKETTIIDFEDYSVKDLLQYEEKQASKFGFISRKEFFKTAALKFSQGLDLEVLIITESGQEKKDETPLGIITRYDIIHPKRVDK